MDNILEIIGILLAFEGLCKALEYVVGKITSQHDKTQKIDENADSLEEYKKKTNAEILELKKANADAQKCATDNFNNLGKTVSDLEKSFTKILNDTLNDHKGEYMKQIKSVENSITEMQAVYQQTVAIVDIKIENLEKAQNKHNNLIERMYKVEQTTAVHEEQIRVGNHRIADLERKYEQ